MKFTLHDKKTREPRGTISIDLKRLLSLRKNRDAGAIKKAEKLAERLGKTGGAG